MKRKGTQVRKFLSMELVLLWLLRGTVQSYEFSNSISTNSIITLFTLSLPWSTLGAKPRTSSSPSTIEIVETVPLVLEESGRGLGSTFLSRSSSSTGSSSLLTNIDFLTQLTNNKQEKESEMDPLKCFPKALCGLSAESAAITRRRKNGLIADYIRLMKAVALNPSVMERSINKMNNPQEEVPQDDDVGDDSESEEDEEDDISGEPYGYDQSRMSLSKRTSPSTGYGYGSATVKPEKVSKSKSSKFQGPQSPQPLPSSAPAGSVAALKAKRKRSKRKDIIPKDSDEFTRQFLMEQAHVDRLKEDGFYNEDGDATNWWNYENEKDPSLEDLVDESGGKLDSNSVESYYTFGSKRRPKPPTSPYKPDGPPQPYAPELPQMMEPQAPPRPKAPPPPKVKVSSSSSNTGDQESSSTTAAIGNFFRGLFGFGNAEKYGGDTFNTDSFFQGFQRSLPDGTPTIVTVDKTKEILTTAIEIGETLRSPNQCNTLFNGCKFQYVELLHVIDEIRRSLADKGKDDFVTADLSKDDDELDDSAAVPEGKRKGIRDGSYGMKYSLSGTSQAETLSPDYSAAASKATKKGGKRSGKKKSSKRKPSRDVSEPSSEIGSDEPTMYGSIQQQFDPHSPPNTRFKDPRYDPYHQSAPQLQHHNYHNSYYSEYENPYDRKPKSFFATIMSWFGFGK